MVPKPKIFAAYGGLYFKSFISLKYTVFVQKSLKYKNSEDTPPPPGGVRTPKKYISKLLPENACT